MITRSKSETFVGYLRCTESSQCSSSRSRNEMPIEMYPCHHRSLSTTTRQTSVIDLAHFNSAGETYFVEMLMVIVHQLGHVQTLPHALFVHQYCGAIEFILMLDAGRVEHFPHGWMLPRLVGVGKEECAEFGIHRIVKKQFFGISCHVRITIEKEHLSERGTDDGSRLVRKCFAKVTGERRENTASIDVPLG